MIPFMKDMLVKIQGMTPEVVAETGNFKLTIIVIKGLAERLDISLELAAQLTASMTINVDDAAYRDNTELFNDMAKALVDVVYNIREASSLELGSKAGWYYTEKAIAQLSLTYG